MKCRYCGKEIKGKKGCPMYVRGAERVKIADFCSEDCRRKASAQIINGLEQSGR